MEKKSILSLFIKQKSLEYSNSGPAGPQSKAMLQWYTFKFGDLNSFTMGWNHHVVMYMYFHKKSKCHRVILLQTKPVSSIHDVSCIGIPYTCNLVKKMVSFSFLVKYNFKKMFCFLMDLVFSMHCVKLILIIVVILFIYFYINFEILLAIL